MPMNIGLRETGKLSLTNTVKVELEDLPSTITGSMSRSNRVVLCDHCKGYGFQVTEKCTDYHKGEYETSRWPCRHCDGDGRMIETTEHMSFNLGHDKVQRMSYVGYKDIVDPHGYDSRWYRYRLDHTDPELERKYPELAAVNYDNYDRLVEHYRTVERLKKEYNE